MKNNNRVVKMILLIYLKVKKKIIVIIWVIIQIEVIIVIMIQKKQKKIQVIYFRIKIKIPQISNPNKTCLNNSFNLIIFLDNNILIHNKYIGYLKINLNNNSNLRKTYSNLLNKFQ